MVQLHSLQVFILLCVFTKYCSTTFYHHHKHQRYFRREIHAGTHIYTPPARFYPGRLPPTFIHSRIIIPYLPLRPLLPPGGTVYAATGHNFPNPLDNLNTYDLPQLTPTSPVLSNGIGGGVGVNRIIPQIPSKTPVDPDTLVVPTIQNNNNDQHRLPPVFVPTDNLPPVFVPTDNLPPVFVPTDNLPPVFVPTDNLPPVFVPTDNLPPVFVSTDNLPPVFVPTDNLPPVVVPTDNLPPVVVPTDNLPPVVVPTENLPPVFVPAFPSDSPKSCSEIGCELGSQCVKLNGYICHENDKDASCHCQRGCRIQNSFIPLGGANNVDNCGNICTCNSIFGVAKCTKKTCEHIQPKPDLPTTGLVLEPVPVDFGPSRGDFPIPTGLDKNDWSFPSQNNFVPPIPFLTTNKFLVPNVQQELTNQGKVSLVPDGKMNTEIFANNNLQNDAMVFPVGG